MSKTEELRQRIETAAHRILGYPPAQWRLKSEAYSLRFDLKALAEFSQRIFAQYEHDIKADQSFSYGQQWGPTITVWPAKGANAQR